VNAASSLSHDNSLTNTDDNDSRSGGSDDTASESDSSKPVTGLPLRQGLLWRTTSWLGLMVRLSIVLVRLSFATIVSTAFLSWLA
jgi:hypothetical protein